MNIIDNKIMIYYPKSFLSKKLIGKLTLIVPYIEEKLYLENSFLIFSNDFF